MPHSHVSTFVRHQMLPRVDLCVGSLRIAIGARCFGGLTGSRVAGALGRVPVECTIADRWMHWQAFGFDVGADAPLTLSAYVDNLYSCSTTMSGAINILEDAAEQLQSTWGQGIKASSRMVLACDGYPADEAIDHGRGPKVNAFLCLGHVLEGAASVRACFTSTKRSMWRAYFGN